MTPRELGFRMPAEWEPHAATWLSWPADDETWPGRVEAAGHAMARWVREIVRERPGFRRERAEILVQDAEHERSVRSILRDWDVSIERVRFHACANNGSWIRDFGPSFVAREADPGDGFGTVAAVRWRFDGWGGKDSDYYGMRAGLDALVAPRVAEVAGAHLFDAGIVLEGGGIEVDGAGTLMASEDCLVRSRERSGETETEKREGLERILSDHLGVSHFLWLSGVRFEGDDTDGHVDNVARFVGPHRVVTVIEENRDDPLHEPLRRNAQALTAMRDAAGKQLDVIEIPLPSPQRYRTIRDGRSVVWRYPASYANFYIANGCVLVPTYADAHDRIALDRIQEAIPDRPVIGMDCCDFILGQGAIHCSTQQQPAGSLSPNTP